MNRYGIVVYPNQGLEQHYPGLHSGDGIYALAGYDDNDIRTRADFPVAVFFQTAAIRDREMEMLVQREPNVMFCPVEITMGFKTQPNPKATQFEFSEKGILPV